VEQIVAVAAVILPTCVWVVWAIRKMIDAELSAMQGVSVIGLSLFLVYLAIAGGFLVAIVIATLMLATLAAVPYLASRIDQRLLFEVDEHILEQAFGAFGENPSNVAALFRIANVLYDAGQRGHAIRVAEYAASLLSSDVDPVSNRSFRDLFRKELHDLKRWREDARPTDFHPIRCLRCSMINPPGVIACGRCQAPVLLDHARRRADPRPFYARLLAGWIALALALSVSVALGWTLSGKSLIFAIAGIVAMLGLFLSWLFRGERVLPPPV
jgi:hypothetical protein